MTVTLTISSTLGGNSISDTVDLGSAAPEETTQVQNLYIRHDGVALIDECEFYITRYTGFDYPGEDPDEDLTTLLGWGDSSKGAKIDMNISSPSFVYFNNTAGYVDVPIGLIKEAIVGGHSVDGEIPVGKSAFVKIGVDLPADSGSARHCAFGLVFSFNSTS